MRKRNSVFIGLGILIIVAAGVTAYMIMRQPVDTAKTLAYGMTYATAQRMTITEECLVANTTLDISAGDRNSVEQMAISHLYDVPAGTNVDVLIASYSKDHVTGSDRYPTKFGSYNFAMNKRANGDWQFIKFEHCH